MSSPVVLEGESEPPSRQTPAAPAPPRGGVYQRSRPLVRTSTSGALSVMSASGCVLRSPLTDALRDRLKGYSSITASGGSGEKDGDGTSGSRRESEDLHESSVGVSGIAAPGTTSFLIPEGTATAEPTAANSGRPASSSVTAVARPPAMYAAARDSSAFLRYVLRGPGAAASYSLSVRSSSGSSPQFDDEHGRLTADDHRVVADPIFEDHVFRVWLKEHPRASQADVLAEAGRRNTERLAHERSSRVKYLRQWQVELGELERRHEFERVMGESESAQKAALSSLQAAPTTPLVKFSDAVTGGLSPAPPPRRTHQVEFEAQKVAWTVFMNSQVALPLDQEESAMSRSSLTLAGASASRRRSTTNGSIISGEGAASTTAAVAEPVAIVVSIPFITDRHESAACTIQCAWRVFEAKLRTERARRLRAERTAAVLHSEESAQLAWEVAIALNEAEAQSKFEIDVAFKALSLWKVRMQATIIRRRYFLDLQKSAQDELQHYAATKIQTVWRGVVTRQWIKELRNPQIVENRTSALRNSAAMKIQRLWRGCHARRVLKRRQEAALCVQLAFRRHAGSRELIALRRANRNADALALQNYASRVISRFLRVCVAFKYRKLLQHASHFELLRRVARGFQGRSVVRALHQGTLDDAAKKIQAVVRGALVRRSERCGVKTGKVDETLLLRNHAAGIVTRFIRRAGTRRRVAAKKNREKAATRIQRVWRGHKGRLRAKAVQLQLVERSGATQKNDAATMIQALYRGYRSRQQCAMTVSSTGGGEGRGGQMLLVATTAVPSAIPEPPEAASFRAQLGGDAANILRHFYTAFIRWPRLRVHVGRAASVVTRSLRLWRARCVRKRQVRELRVTNAAMTIQRDFRGYSARLKVGHARSERQFKNRHVQEEEAAAVIVAFFRAVVKQKTAPRRKR